MRKCYIVSFVVILCSAITFAKTFQWSEWKNSLEPQGIRGKDVLLAESKQARYKIVIPEKASPIEIKASADLSQWLGDITGASFVVVPDSYQSVEREISVGATNRVPEGYPSEDLKTHGYQIFQKGDKIFVLGGTKRGLLNGVYALLEEDLGCRWYDSEDAKMIPKISTLKFKPASRVSVPQLQVRDPFYYSSFEPTWALRNRTTYTNGDRNRFGVIPAEYGGGMRYPDPMFVHTYNFLLPPKKYFESNPEYFMMDDTGKRIDKQLCETNPEVARIVTRAVLEILEKSPETQLFSVSKNDISLACSCPNCKQLNQEEGSNSASMLTLVNYVANAVKDKYPNLTITTLAYLDTIKVPRTIRPASNVGIRVCNDMVSWVNPLKPARKVPEYVDIVTQWSGVSKKLYAWDYTVNYSHQIAPFPNMEVIADNVRFFVSNNAQGYMSQATYESPCAGREQMRCWVIGKLLWDPQRDVNELMQDFVWGYYGAAAPAVIEYYEILRERAHAVGEDFGNTIRYEMDCLLFPSEFVKDASRIFENAMQLAENKEIRRRVEREFISVMYVELEQGPEVMGAQHYISTLEKFKEITRRENLDYFREASKNRETLIEKWTNRI
jgi:hypothetical protein